LVIVVVLSYYFAFVATAWSGISIGLTRSGFLLFFLLVWSSAVDYLGHRSRDLKHWKLLKLVRGYHKVVLSIAGSIALSVAGNFIFQQLTIALGG
jgi:hypothetical protein